MDFKDKERRTGGRLACSGDYFFFNKDQSTKLECELKNISITGACIETSAKLASDDQIILHICADKDVEMAGRIVWQKQQSYGLLFLLETAEAFDNISYLMNNRPV